MSYLIIDNRMREIEKQKLREMGYELIEIQKNENIYEEISSHVDIHLCKVKNKIIVEKSKYLEIVSQIKKIYTDIEIGNEYIHKNYPDDIKYNVCIIGDRALHKLDSTDLKVKEELIDNNYKLINTNQGYTNCSIAVIDDNSAIVTDKGLYKILKKNNVDVLYIEEELDIKLLQGNGYSRNKGFIGGAISRIDENIVVFGDINKIDKEHKIKDFINQKKLNLIYFRDFDVIDYGGVVKL